MKNILLAIITGLFCLSLTAQTAMLKLNPEKNKVYTLRSVSEQTVSQTINGAEQTTESIVNYVISLKMIDLASEFMIMEIRFDTLITTTNSMGRFINISSADGGDLKSSESDEVMSYIMNRLSKNSIYTKIDFSGKPLEIINSAMLSDMILKDTSSIVLTGPSAAEVKNQIANTISDENLKTMIGGFTWFLPGEETSTGEEWTQTQQITSGGMALEVKTVYSLEGIAGNVAEITAESSIRAADIAKPIQSSGATVTYDNLRGISKSNIKIDLSTGIIIEEAGKTNITGSLGISAPGFTMEMPMDINGVTKVTALK